MVDNKKDSLYCALNTKEGKFEGFVASDNAIDLKAKIAAYKAKGFVPMRIIRVHGSALTEIDKEVLHTTLKSTNQIDGDKK